MEEIEPEYIWNGKKYDTLIEAIRAHRKELRDSRPWYTNLYWKLKAKYLSYKFRLQDYYKK